MGKCRGISAGTKEQMLNELVQGQGANTQSAPIIWGATVPNSFNNMSACLLANYFMAWSMQDRKGKPALNFNARILQTGEEGLKTANWSNKDCKVFIQVTFNMPQ